MPRIYLNPSLQTYNLFVSGGSEEEYVSLIADAMEPYLLASGIAFTRNDPKNTISQVMQEVNQGAYDLFFAMHTATAPPFMAGFLQGPEVLYLINSSCGGRLAEIIVSSLKRIYPASAAVKATPTAMRKEFQTTVPAVSVELGYNDNFEDAQWIKENCRGIGRALAHALTIYFGASFVEPMGN